MRLLAALVTCCGAYTVDWNAQFDADPKTLTVDADADVAFEWSGGHDVWLLDEDGYEGCAFSGGSYLGGSSGVVAAGPAAGETLYFSCSVGSHCCQGQKIAITGAAADDDADSTSWYYKKLSDGVPRPREPSGGTPTRNRRAS